MLYGTNCKITLGIVLLTFGVTLLVIGIIFISETFVFYRGMDNPDAGQSVAIGLGCFVTGILCLIFAGFWLIMTWHDKRTKKAPRRFVSNPVPPPTDIHEVDTVPRGTYGYDQRYEAGAHPGAGPDIESYEAESLPEKSYKSYGETEEGYNYEESVS